MKKVFGKGVRDSDGVVKLMRTVSGKGEKQRQVMDWVCPYYRVWESMLSRCYSESFLKRNPTYRGCYVSEDWLTFSNFKSWMEKQDWEGKQLDKDLLSRGNKEYGEAFCMFVSQEVNLFTSDRSASRGDYPIGVTVNPRGGRYVSRVSVKGKTTHLGTFSTPEEAHLAWRFAKHKMAVELASEQEDKRVSKALSNWYKV